MPYDAIGHSSEREAWLELRRTGVGGSDAPAILGLTPWASPTSVQADKWGLLDEPDEAEHLKWGKRLEAVIFEALAEELGEAVVPDGRLLRSRTHPFMLWTPDARTTSGVWVEAKNTIKAEEWKDGPPERVVVQCQHGLAVTGGKQAIAAALILGNRMAWARVDRDEEMIERLIDAEREFWRLTEEREPYPSDGSEHAIRALGRIYPDDTGEVVTLGGAFTDLDRERLDLLAEKKRAESRLREIDAEFRRAMQGASEAVLQDGTRYTLRTQHRKAYTAKATSYRVLRRKEAK